MSLARHASLVWIALSVSALHSQSATPPLTPTRVTAPEMTVCEAPDFSSCHKEKGVVVPTLLHSIDPKYPLEARQERIQGISIVQFIVDTSGIPQNVEVIDSITNRLPKYQAPIGHELDTNAVAAAKQFRFKPASLNGQPVAVRVKMEQRFRLY